MAVLPVQVARRLLLCSAYQSKRCRHAACNNLQWNVGVTPGRVSCTTFMLFPEEGTCPLLTALHVISTVMAGWANALSRLWQFCLTMHNQIASTPRVLQEVVLTYTGWHGNCCRLQATNTGSEYSQGTGTGQGHMGGHMHRSGDPSIQSAAGGPQVQLSLLVFHVKVRAKYAMPPVTNTCHTCRPRSPGLSLLSKAWQLG